LHLLIQYTQDDYRGSDRNCSLPRIAASAILLKTKAGIRFSEVHKPMQQKIRNLMSKKKGNYHRPLQSISEFARWLELLDKIDAKVGMEIGVRHGGSAHWTLNCLPGIERYIGVDIQPNDRSGWLAKAHESVRLVHEDSTSEKCRNTVKAILGERKLDFLFIDGMHDHHYVQSDWIMYHGLVRSGGLIGFHDINFAPPCAELFRKVKNSGQWHEAIIADNTPENYEEDFPPQALKIAKKCNKIEGFGIGVVCI